MLLLRLVFTVLKYYKMYWFKQLLPFAGFWLTYSFVVFRERKDCRENVTVFSLFV